VQNDDMAVAHAVGLGTDGPDDVDRKLGDLLADGRIAEDDAQAVRDFRRFLAAKVTMHPQTAEEKALRKAWLPYLLGEGDPPPETPAGGVP
jgi:hypothetical protein